VSRPSITVAVATVDRPDGLRRCLEAVRAGTVAPDEIVVVDQGDVVRTEAVLRAVRSGVPLVHLAQPGRGLSVSRNAALETASSDVVAVTDDDCVPDAGWLAALVNAFSEPAPPDAVCGRVLPLGPPTPDTVPVASRASEIRREFVGRALPWAVGTGANFAVRRDLVRSIGGYDERLGAGTAGGAGEDLDVLRRLLAADAHIRFEPSALVYHERQPPERRRATRISYGRGAGACCALWARDADPFAVRALGAWIAMRFRLLAVGVARRDARAVTEELLVLRGTLGGLAYGLRAR
jgi:glycosyltransferase involved in cell wall biosynthesis